MPCLSRRHHVPRKEILTYPKWVFLNRAPCRIIETLSYILLLAICIGIFIYAAFAYKNWEMIATNVSLVCLINIQELVGSDGVDDIDEAMEYLTSTKFLVIFYANSVLAIFLCTVCFSLAPKWKGLMCTFVIFSITGIVTISAIYSYYFLAEWHMYFLEEWYLLGHCAIPCFILSHLIVKFSCAYKTLNFALESSISGFYFFHHTWASSIVCVIVNFLMHVSWLFMCTNAYMYIQFQRNDQFESMPINTLFNVHNDVIFYCICGILVMCYFIGKSVISNSVNSIYSGAIARVLLTNDPSIYTESTIVTICKLGGTISFSSFNFGCIEILKSLVEPKNGKEPSMLHIIPFYYFFANWYKYFIENYCHCCVQFINNYLDFATPYSLVASVIYGDTLCASGMMLSEVSILNILRQDEAVEFIMFFITISNAILTSAICVFISEYGIYLGYDIEIIEPINNKIISFIILCSTFLFTYFLSKVIFEPIITLVRTTFVIYELEPEMFQKNANAYFQHFQTAKSKLYEKSTKDNSIPQKYKSKHHPNYNVDPFSLIEIENNPIAGASNS